MWSRKHQLCSLKYCQGKWALKEKERPEGKLFVTCYVSAFALKNGADGLCFSKRWHDAIFNQTTSQEFANQWNPTPNSCSWDKLQVPTHWKLHSKVHDLLEFYVARAIFLTTSKNIRGKRCPHPSIIDQPDRFFYVITCREKLFCGLIFYINNSDRWRSNFS